MECFCQVLYLISLPSHRSLIANSMTNLKFGWNIVESTWTFLDKVLSNLYLWISNQPNGHYCFGHHLWRMNHSSCWSKALVYRCILKPVSEFFTSFLYTHIRVTLVCNTLRLVEICDWGFLALLPIRSINVVMPFCGYRLEDI